MDLDQLPDHIVYSKNVIEFVTVAAETCLFLEHATDFSREDFVVKSVKLFRQVYLTKVPNGLWPKKITCMYVNK